MIPQYVIVHHSLTKDSGTVSWGAIRRYHTQTLGWRDIGYHAGVELVASGGMSTSGYEALFGRPMDEPGAHTRGSGMNQKSLGLCVVGNFDDEAPPKEQLVVAASVVAAWCRLFNIPVFNVLPHNAYSGKTCPGKLFPMKAFRLQVDALV